MNLCINYQYRDGDNYKKHGKVVVANPSGLNAEAVEACITDHLNDGRHFIAHQVGLPEIIPRLDEQKARDADHCWHEFSDVDETDSQVTHDLTIDDLLKKFEAAHREGWKEFGPYESSEMGQQP